MVKFLLLTKIRVKLNLPEGYGFLVLIVPSAAEFSGLVPNLLYLGVVLDHDCVLEESTGPRVSAIAVEAIFCA